MIFSAVLALTIFDIAASYVGLKSGSFSEGNPIMCTLITNYELVPALVLSAAVAIMSLAILYKLRHTQVAQLGLIFILVIKIYVAILHFIWIQFS
ncbi:MAG: DUF5658 family protein [Clostridiales bacterium]|nr:DUF5658 family protein [Clostridiales bacterium]